MCVYHHPLAIQYGILMFWAIKHTVAELNLHLHEICCLWFFFFFIKTTCARHNSRTPEDECKWFSTAI
jgi:hypothetical protein